MNDRRLLKYTFLPGLIVLIVLLLVGCGGKTKETRTSQGYMDTPEFHVQRGDEALMKHQYEDARSSFRKALKLKPDFSQALSGMAAASAYEASRPGITIKTQKNVLEEAEDQIEKALDTAVNKQQRSRAHSFAIQVYLALKMPDKWYKKAMDHFEDATDLTPNDPEPYFFMGKAETVQLNYAEANKMFHKVLSIGGKYEEEANAELKKVQRIQRAMPGSRFGAKIANVEKITRADVAALFIAELRLDRLYKNQAQSSSGSYQAPKSQQKFKTDPLQKFPEAVDISGHPLEGAIREVMKLRVKGLSPDPSHKFYPDQEFKRAEFAQLIQDVLIKITNNNSLSTQYIGERSPFPDVSQNVWYYNAARTVVNRGLMQVNNKVTGAFAPLETVSGADALLTIRTMKEILKAYLR